MQINRETDYLNLLRWMATAAVVVIHLLSGITDVYPESLNINKMTTYCTIHNLMNWCVPVFVMISGILFLNPEKNISIRILLKKYIRRIVFALFLFGTMYAWIEIIFVQKTIKVSQIFSAVYNVVMGNTWAVMWYLYMLIGLYMITPLVKGFLKDVNDEVLIYLISILFIFTSLIPTVNKLFNININFYLPINSVFIFYYLLGYFIHYNCRHRIKNKMILYSGLILSIVFIIGTSVFVKSETIGFLYEYESPIIVLLSASIFIWLKDTTEKIHINSKYNYLCFGIYLIHCFYINLLYKFLKITPAKYPSIISIPLFFIVVFMLSILTSFILNKISIFRKYVL